MLMPTHLLITCMLGQALGFSTFYEWGLALIFGVAIDLDHLIPLWKLKYFTPQYGFTGKETPVILHSVLNEPTGILLIAPLSFILGTSIPLFFWVLHIFLDLLVIFERRPFWPFSKKILRYGLFPAGSTTEWILSLAGLSILAIYLLIS